MKRKIVLSRKSALGRSLEPIIEREMRSLPTEHTLLLAGRENGSRGYQIYYNTLTHMIELYLKGETKKEMMRAEEEFLDWARGYIMATQKRNPEFI